MEETKIEKIFEPSAVQPVRRKSYSIDAHKCLSKEEYNHLLRKLKQHKDDPKYLTATALLYCAIFTGARISEILNLRKIDVMSRMSIFIRGLKGSKNREVPIPVFAYWTIVKYMCTHDEEKLFPFSYSYAVKIWNFWRPVKKGIHSLRHTFAIRLYEKTKDLRLVQVAMGHKNIQNTMIYAEYVYQYSEMRRMMLGRYKR